MPKRIALITEYDGTAYSGWQTQKGLYSVQQTIERAIFKITRQNSGLTAAGRTDAGVHALAQCAHFDTDSKIPADRIADALNANLPGDIVIRRSVEVQSDFHARFSAVGKHYRYLILNSRRRSALDKNRRYFVPVPLDVQAMRAAASPLIGRNDFTAFCSAGDESKNKVRHLWRIAISANGPHIAIDVFGAGFLRHMVRIISGTLIGAGLGKIDAAAVYSALINKDRTSAGITAPAHGLYLVKVYYPFNLLPYFE